MKMFVWSDHLSFLAIAYAESVACARQLMLAEMGESGDGSCPERDAARRRILSETPSIWVGPNAEFALTSSAELRENEAFLYKVQEQLREATARDSRFHCAQPQLNPKADSSEALLDRQKRDLATAIHDAWPRYTDLFGEPPHGTLKQMNAFVELMRLDLFVQEIGNRAIFRWYVEDQGIAKNSHETDSDGGAQNPKSQHEK